jgi:heat shock protein HslJ
VSGSRGCNTYRGQYAIDGPSLTPGPLITTRKACPEPIMTAETAYVAALEGVDRWAVPQDAAMGHPAHAPWCRPQARLRSAERRLSVTAAGRKMG